MLDRPFDDGVTAADLRAAVVALKDARGREVPLDRFVDAVTPRRVAHVAETAIRAVADGRGLCRFRGTDTVLISAAVAWLNSKGFVIVPTARTRPQRPQATHPAREGVDAFTGEGVTP